jgi:Na+/H+ antiporter NhaC
MLIAFCFVGMIYSGGFFSGADLITAFSDCDASVGLALGGFFAVIFTVIFYLCRGVLSFKDLMGCIPEGFKAMTSAILILALAWTLKAMTDSLGAATYVEGLVKAGAGYMLSFLPAIIFLIGCVLAFATGTSWGTFGILIPIVVDAFADKPELMIIAISACMAGAVCGDHCSPISDTTIMASAGAQCDHVNHVSTQLPYAITCAAVSFVAYVIAGFVQNVYISLAVAFALMALTLLVLKLMQKNKAAV